jgi:colanic acid/amylovoran biosynthesis glycosyltransferase
VSTTPNTTVARVPQVMLVCTASNVGGMERVVCSLARGFTAAGWAVRTFFPDPPQNARLIEWCADQGVVAEVHPAVLDAADPHSRASARSLRELVRQVDPDVVNLHYGDNALSLYDMIGVRMAGRKRTVVATIHHPSPWSRALVRKRVMTAIASRMAQATTTFASATRDIIRAAGVPRRRIHVIPCGVPVPATLAGRAPSREQFQLGEDAFVIGSLGRLVPYKGFDALIEAVDCDELRGSTLLVGGDGPARPALETLAASEHRGADVRFLGSLPEIGPLFAASDVFALPSRLEGFGLVYVEAAMYGVPSVGYRVGGVPEAVLDRRTGILVEPGDIDGLRRALVELRGDTGLRQTLGRAARQRAHDELDEDMMVRRFIDLFDGLGVGDA